MLSRVQQPHARGDDRERITRARQAAEALFTPKPQITEELASEAPPAARSVRKPRVLGISPPAPAPHETVEPRVGPDPQINRAIPQSQFARIRALAEYGMTVSQVAEVYGVTVTAIERILRQD